MCFKIRFALDWQPIGGIGHLLYSRKGDAKGDCAAAPGIILVGIRLRGYGVKIAAPPGSQVSGAKTPFLDAKAAGAAQVGRRRRAFPTLSKRARYYAGVGATAPRKFLVGIRLHRSGVKIAAPPGSQVSGAKTPFLDAKAALAAQVGRRRRAFPTLSKLAR